jgi:hypothetical protein
MNAFMINAVIAGDMEYTEPYESNNEIPVAFSYGEMTTKAGGGFRCLNAALRRS